MGRNRNRNRKPKPSQEIDFNPPPAESSLRQSFSFTQLKNDTMIRSEIRNSQTVLSGGSQFSSSDFQQELYKGTVNFTIKQWLLLGMSRIVPNSDKSIRISMKRNQITGPKDNVQKFCKLAQSQILEMKLKILKFKCEISLQDIQFEMKKQWRYQIFSAKLLRNVAEKIEQNYDIKEQMKIYIQSILNKQDITIYTRFLWVQKNVYEEAYEILKNIYKQRVRKLNQEQQTIVSLLKNMQSHERSNTYQQSKKNNSSNNQSQNRISKKQSQSNSSADYSTILKSKVSQKNQESLINSQNYESKKKLEYKKKKYEPKHKKEEPKKFEPKSSMKNMRSFQNSFEDGNFTKIYPNKYSDESEQNYKPQNKILQRQQNRNRDESKFQRRRPTQKQHYDKAEQDSRPRRRQRKEKQQNSCRQNRYSQSSDNNEDQTRIYDRHQQRQRVKRQGNRQPRRNIIFTQEYPSQYFSKEHFKDWSKKNKTLKRTDQYTLEMTQKFSPDEGQTYIQITFYGDDPRGDIIYAINLYFKYEKLIKIRAEQQVRHKMIKNFQCKHNWLTVEYKKIYTRESNPKYDDLRKLAKKDNTAQYMNKYKNVTHAFLMIGLMTEVSVMEDEIETFIKEVQNTCRKVDILLKFPKIDEFTRRKEVQSLIQQVITQQVSRFPQRYKIYKITPTYAQVLVEIELFKVEDRDVDRVKNQLTQRFERLIDSFQFQSDKYKNCKNAFNTIFHNFLIFQNSKNGLTLIAKTSQIKEQMLQVNKEMQKSFKIRIHQLGFKQKSQMILHKDFLLKTLKQPQFLSMTPPRYEQNDVLKIVLIGPSIVIDNLLSKIQEFQQTIKAKISQYNISLKQQQLQILQKDKQFQKKIQQDFKITLKFKNDYKLGAVFIIEPHLQQGIKHPKKTIFFENEFNFQSLPKNSVFFFRNQKQINLLKQPFILPLKNHIKTQGKNPNPVYFEDKIKQCFFIYGYEAQPEIILNSSKDTTSNKVDHIFIYTPEISRTINDFLKEMIIKLCQNKDYVTKELVITMISRKNTDLKRILTYKEGKITQASKTNRKWYTLEGNTKLFYSDLGNKKIQEAYANKVSEIQLNNEDLNLTNKTHQLDFQNKTMVHTQSGKSFPIKTLNNKITFILDGNEKTLPDSQYLKVPKTNSFWRGGQYTDCQLSIGFYKIDLNRLVQTNLFSKFERKIGFDEEEIKQSQNFDLEVSYDVKSPKLCFQYSVEHQNLIKKAQNFVKQTLQKKLIIKSKPLNNQITADLILKFKKQAQQQDVSVEISQNNNQFILKAYNQKNIDIFLKIISHLSKTSKAEITYPDQWTQQTQDIQTFVVPQNTQEFTKIQAAFTAGKITQLIRIQNKIVFRKFFEEKIFLKELNDGKDIKQMLLYHGTRQTDPKLIYEDKQECFNVNYTGENNLLGRGTYFAQRPQYSVNYSHRQNPISRIKSMFYCRVLVGDSEKCPAHKGSIRDTSFKNQAKGLRYESMTDFLQGSNVYVVYKNRRAYPLYLIKYQ